MQWYRIYITLTNLRLIIILMMIIITTTCFSNVVTQAYHRMFKLWLVYNANKREYRPMKILVTYVYVLMALNHEITVRVQYIPRLEFCSHNAYFILEILECITKCRQIKSCLSVKALTGKNVHRWKRPQEKASTGRSVNRTESRHM